MPTISASSTPKKKTDKIRRIAVLFAGGPAPAANAVISTCAASFLKSGVEVCGVMHGYSNLVKFSADRPMVAGQDYINIDFKTLKRTRNSQGILIGTARTNPGEFVSAPEHLKDPERVKPLKTVYEALCSMGVDALVSIGGDDTLKTANKLKRYQESLPAGSKHIPVVHLPKTIDNDYRGIDFTFGYFTSVEFLASELAEPDLRRRSVALLLPHRANGAAAPAGSPTAPRSPAKRAWCSAWKTSLMNSLIKKRPKTAACGRS